MIDPRPLPCHPSATRKAASARSSRVLKAPACATIDRSGPPWATSATSPGARIRPARPRPGRESASRRSANRASRPKPPPGTGKARRLRPARAAVPARPSRRAGSLCACGGRLVAKARPVSSAWHRQRHAVRPAAGADPRRTYARARWAGVSESGPRPAPRPPSCGSSRAGRCSAGRARARPASRRSGGRAAASAPSRGTPAAGARAA